MKTLLAAGMILGSLVALSGSVLADPTDAVDNSNDSTILLRGGSGEDPCNGLVDTNCTCKYNMNYCSKGEKCKTYTAYACIEG